MCECCSKLKKENEKLKKLILKLELKEMNNKTDRAKHALSEINLRAEQLYNLSKELLNLSDTNNI